MPTTPRPVTWIALLGQWMDFARSVLGKPSGDAFQRRWRASVTPIITLQAVMLALEEIDRLPVDEQFVGIDRAAVMIREQAAALARHWSEESMPEAVIQLIDDARMALRVAELGPAIELVLPTPNPLDGEDTRSGGNGGTGGEPDDAFVMPDCRDLVERIAGSGTFPGTLRLALPGTLLLPGEPVGHIIGGHGWGGPMAHPGAGWGDLLERVEPARPAPSTDNHDPEGPLRAPFQVYRQTEGDPPRIARDILVSILAEPVAGRPLLMTMIEEGEPVRVVVPDPAKWRDQQRAMWPTGGGGGGSGRLEIRVLESPSERGLLPSLLEDDADEQAD